MRPRRIPSRRARCTTCQSPLAVILNAPAREKSLALALSARLKSRGVFRRRRRRFCALKMEHRSQFECLASSEHTRACKSCTRCTNSTKDVGALQPGVAREWGGGVREPDHHRLSRPQRGAPSEKMRPAASCPSDDAAPAPESVAHLGHAPRRATRSPLLPFWLPGHAGGSWWAQINAAGLSR